MSAISRYQIEKSITQETQFKFGVIPFKLKLHHVSDLICRKRGRQREACLENTCM